MVMYNCKTEFKLHAECKVTVYWTKKDVAISLITRSSVEDK